MTKKPSYRVEVFDVPANCWAKRSIVRTLDEAEADYLSALMAGSYARIIHDGQIVRQWGMLIVGGRG